MMMTWCYAVLPTTSRTSINSDHPARSLVRRIYSWSYFTAHTKLQYITYYIAHLDMVQYRVLGLQAVLCNHDDPT